MARFKDSWKPWIPYTGSGIQASAIGMHKVAAKTLLSQRAFPVPAGAVVKRGEKVSRATVMRAAKLRWPVRGKACVARIHDRRHDRAEAGAMA